MAPSLTKSFRPCRIIWDSIKIDTKKKTFTFTTEFGHTIISKLQNSVSVNQSMEYPGHPEYVVNFGFKPIKVDNEKNVTNFKEMKNILKKRNMIENEDKFDDVMIGFVYAQPEDPMNHTWMLQFRVNGQVVGTLNSLQIDTKNCPLKTFAWHENNIWHLRFFVERKDIKMLEEYEPNKVRLVGKGIKTIITSTSEDIPKEYEKLRMRCNVKDNLWIIEFLDKKNNTIKDFIMKNIKINSPTYGEALFDHDKPWVSSYSIHKEIQDIQILDDLMVIQGVIPNQ